MQNIEIDYNSVTWAYRLFLEREPESRRAIEEKLLYKSVQNLRHAFLASAEYKAKNGHTKQATITGDEPDLKIDTSATKSELEAMYEHLRRVWERLGSEQPFWSVLSDDRYLTEHVKNNYLEKDFYKSGEVDVARIFRTLERNGVKKKHFSTCIEFGCGIGRVTGHLAKVSDKVWACDVSESHLGHASRHAETLKAHNVCFHRLCCVDDLSTLPKSDFVYSVLVLQHNPPPVMAKLLQQLIRSLEVGGVAIFQIPTYRKGYSFSIERYLTTLRDHAGIEMHVLPQFKVFEIIHNEHGRMLEALEDTMTGPDNSELSNTFTVLKVH